VKILFSAGACTALVGASLVATAVPASACPYGTVPSHFDGVCVSGTSGAGSAGTPAAAPHPMSGTGAVFGGGVNQLPTVNGIPCTPEHLGTCIGMAQSQG